MRFVTGIVAFLALCGAASAQEQVSAQDAYRYVDKSTEIQVEFAVQRTGANKTKTLYFLNSGKDLKQKENLTIVIPSEVVDQMTKKGLVGTPEEYFRGRTVKATGFVVSFKDRAGPQLRLKDASQLEWAADVQSGGSLFSSVYTYLVLGGILVLGGAAWLFANRKSEE